MLDHLAELVVKEVHGAGGYGMLVGPAATQAEIDDFRARRQGQPDATTSRSRRWRCRPARPSSRAASRRATSTCGRSCSVGKTVQMVPGGLTRVALKEGSLVVNSSQGGGTKDTWVLEETERTDARRTESQCARRSRSRAVTGGAIMLSRTADHLFWMARYMERAENTARMLDVNYQTSLLPQTRRHGRAGLARAAVASAS